MQPPQSLSLYIYACVCVCVCLHRCVCVYVGMCVCICVFTSLFHPLLFPILLTHPPPPLPPAPPLYLSALLLHPTNPTRVRSHFPPPFLSFLFNAFLQSSRTSAEMERDSGLLISFYSYLVLEIMSQNF